MSHVGWHSSVTFLGTGNGPITAPSAVSGSDHGLTGSIQSIRKWSSISQPCRAARS
jgi:hypothetical protein